VPAPLNDFHCRTGVGSDSGGHRLVLALGSRVLAEEARVHLKIWPVLVRGGYALRASVAVPQTAAEWEQLESSIRGLLGPLVADHDDLDDLTQLCLIKVWRRGASFGGRSAFSSWLYPVVRNEHLSWLRRRGRDADSVTGSGFSRAKRRRRWILP